MIAATLSFTFMVGCVKLVRDDLSSVEVMWWRGAIATPIAGALAVRIGFRVRRWRLFALRAALGATAMACFFTALKALPLATSGLIQRVQPLLIAVLAPLVLGRQERPERGVWIALAIGFAGICFLLEPGAGGPVGWAVGVALLGTMLAAGAHLAVRALGASEHPLTLVFWFQLLIVAGTALVLLFERGSPLPRAPVQHLLPLVFCGVSGALGQTLMTWAYKVDRAARVAPASWFGPLWGALGDWLVWHRAPTSYLILGGLLIASSGVFLIFPRSSSYLWAAPGRTQRWVRARLGR